MKRNAAGGSIAKHSAALVVGALGLGVTSLAGANPAQAGVFTFPHKPLQELRTDAPVTQIASAGLHMCDRLAAHPLDLDRVVDAVSYEILLTQLSEAVSACRDAVRENPGVARFEFQLGRALAADGNDEEAANWYLAAAERNHAAAQFNLAVAYSTGKGVTQDAGKANDWYRRAADQGYSHAMWSLANNLNAGTGGPQDAASAAAYLIKAYLAGHAKAQRAFQQNLEGWDIGTRREVQRALQAAGHYNGPVNGEIDAATLTAMRRYAAAENGTEPPASETDQTARTDQTDQVAETTPEGVVPDTAPVISQSAGYHECDRLAAHAVDPGRVGSAVTYSELKAHISEAISACREAAAKHPGVMRFEYQLGRALAANDENREANDWYTKAAERGYTAAMFNLAIAYDEGLGVEKDQSIANGWYRKAADKGRADAMWNLAINLDKGMGEKADPTTSAFYLLAAYKAGHERTIDAFGKSLGSWEVATRREVQKILREAGHYSGDTDGEINDATRAAAEAFRNAT